MFHLFSSWFVGKYIFTTKPTPEGMLRIKKKIKKEGYVK